MTNQCTTCATLQAENARLRAENFQLKQQVLRLKAKLAKVLKFAASTIAESNKVLSEHQARGKWAWHKSAKEVAEKILELAGL